MNNRRKKIKELITRLHQGENVEQLKDEFKEAVSGLDSLEIARIEEELIAEGMDPDKIRKLCDLHLLMFRETLEGRKKETPEGHPINILSSEHEHILKFTEELKKVTGTISRASSYDQIQDEISHLKHIASHLVEANLHHQREEDVLFPKVREKGIIEPPDIMVSEHEILKPRKKELLELANNYPDYDFKEFVQKLQEITADISEILPGHIYKEDNILYPIALEVVDKEEWDKIRGAFDRIGYCCFTPGVKKQVSLDR